jgi:hypothetical protein
MAAVAAALCLCATPAANALPPPLAGDDYLGGCVPTTVSEMTTTGGNYEGVWRVVIVATFAKSIAGVQVPNPLGEITDVECSLLVNGSQVAAMSAPPGTGVTANAERVTYAAEPTDTVTVCTDVTVSHGDIETSVRTTSSFHDCNDLSSGFEPDPPPEVDQVVDLVVSLVNNALGQVDPLLCTVLRLLAPTVNGLGHPEVVYIDYGTPQPSVVTGDYDGDNFDADLFLAGLLVWDCPPYNFTP